MTTGVLVAVGDAGFEADVLSAATGGGLHVVRRCVDVADVLATAAARQAAVALVSPRLGGLDTDVVARLRADRVATIGVVVAELSPEAETLRGIGVDALVTVADLPGLAVLVREVTVERNSRDRHQVRESAMARPGDPALLEGADRGRENGLVLAVWGPTGAPGRSTVALGLASSLAAADASTLLVDADVYGGVQAQLLGLLDESSGLLAAARSANKGRLDVVGLAGHCRSVSPALRVLTGLPRSDRWVELSPVLLRRIVDTARALCAVTVLDCAFCVELDEEISYDTVAPRRNGATLAALELADRVVVVGAADPVGLGRLLRALADLAVLVPGVSPYVVVNRMRSSLGWSTDDVAALVRSTCQVEVAAFLPDDPAACDRAVVRGESLAECAAGSKLAKALGQLAATLAGEVRTARTGVRAPT